MFCQLASDLQTFGSPLGFHDSFILPASSGIRAGWFLCPIFAGENSATERTVRCHAQSVMGTHWQMLDFGHPVQQVVVRLAHDRAIDPDQIAKPADLSHAPCPKI